MLPSFIITIHSKDLYLLESIQSFFGVGKIKRNSNRDIVYYTVSAVKELMDVIIPFFEKHPLLTQKRADFELFKMVVKIMSRKEHLKIEGLRKTIAIKVNMNQGLSNELKLAFSDVIAVPRPIVELPKKDFDGY